jgi:cold shock protein
MLVLCINDIVTRNYPAFLTSFNKSGGKKGFRIYCFYIHQHIIIVSIIIIGVLQMEKGTVKWFNESKGFGFIEKSSGGDVFVHHSGIDSDGFKTLTEGAEVEFNIEESEKGPRAVSVKEI